MHPRALVCAFCVLFGILVATTKGCSFGSQHHGGGGVNLKIFALPQVGVAGVLVVVVCPRAGEPQRNSESGMRDFSCTL